MERVTVAPSLPPQPFDDIAAGIVDAIKAAAGPAVAPRVPTTAPTPAPVKRPSSDRRDALQEDVAGAWQPAVPHRGSKKMTTLTLQGMGSAQFTVPTPRKDKAMLLLAPVHIHRSLLRQCNCTGRTQCKQKFAFVDVQRLRYWYMQATMATEQDAIRPSVWPRSWNACCTHQAAP